MVVGEHFVNPHSGAAYQHVHVSRDDKAVILLVSIKRISAGITACAARELANVEVLFRVREATRTVASGGLRR